MKIKILHLEDVPAEAELVARELNNGGINAEILLVNTKEKFIKELIEFSPDVILCDNSIPQFDVEEALLLLKEMGITTPFIIITATMTEEFVVEIMKQGADDYIIKDRLHRLPLAVLNSIENHRLKEEEKEKAKLMINNEKRFRALIENGRDAVVILSSEGKPFYVSPSLERILGYTEAETLQMKIFDIFHPDDIAWKMEIWEQIIHSPGISISVDSSRMMHKDGSWRWFEGTLTNLLEDPAVMGIVDNFRDITVKKKQAESLVLSTTELEQFAYVVSHDLQEPLRMISSFLMQLEKKYRNTIDDKGREYIYYAVDGAKRMRQIILDLLEFSTIGKTDAKLEKLDLNELVEEIQILLRNQIQEMGAIISTEKLPEISSYKIPMLQVFQNLIGNALKYNKDAVVPQIHIASKEEKMHWQISVTDNGIGINEQYFEKIFVIFQRLHDKYKYSGTGIGLSITKKIIENQGGNIWLKSDEGKGSTFYFTIPKR